MWYLKFNYKHRDCIYLPLLEKYDLQIEFYPLGYYLKGNYVYVSAIHIVKGEKENIKNYIEQLKKDRRIIKIEVSRVIFTLTKEPCSLKIYKAIYNPELFYVTPVLILLMEMKLLRLHLGIEKFFQI